MDGWKRWYVINGWCDGWGEDWGGLTPLPIAAKP
jgi:hypothetical protein